MLSTQSEGTPLTHAEPAHHPVRLLGWCGHAVRNSIQPPMTRSGPSIGSRVASIRTTTLFSWSLFILRLERKLNQLGNDLIEQGHFSSPAAAEPPLILCGKHATMNPSAGSCMRVPPD